MKYMYPMPNLIDHYSRRNATGDTHMNTKLYTAVQTINNSRNGSVSRTYAHVGGDTAFSKNSKATTYKRTLGDGLTNWSFTVAGRVNPGDKVYVVLRKVMVGDARTLLWLPIPARGFINRRDANTYRNQHGGKAAGLVIYSFTVDQPAEQDYTVTVTVRARSQADANAKVTVQGSTPAPAPSLSSRR